MIGMDKKRLDVLLVERGLVETRSLAQRLIMAGQVRVNGQVASKIAAGVDPLASIEIDHGPRYVSRGGEKLEAALQAFEVVVEERVCADVGASTGGFTDCLLQHGALRVYAIDVGRGILDWKLRKDPRVVVMEETNARYVSSLPELVGLISIDASFISLKTLLPVVRGWMNEQGEREDRAEAGDIIALIKPQFEAGRKVVTRGKGVVRDPAVHRQVIEEVLASARQAGYGPRGLIRSPLVGPKGNVEFLLHLAYPEREQREFTFEL